MRKLSECDVGNSMQNKPLADGVGAAVDGFASLMQGLMNSSVEHRAKMFYREYLKEDVVNTLIQGNHAGVLMMLATGEPKAWELSSVPTYREYLGLSVIDYGHDPVMLKRAYLGCRPHEILALPSSNSLKRVERFIWMTTVEAMTW